MNATLPISPAASDDIPPDHLADLEAVGRAVAAGQKPDPRAGPPGS